MSNLNGVLLIDKPKEFTSFDVIAVVRRLTGQKKLGHTGTLDPNATGVLPVLLGTATKTQDLILNHNKSYTAEFQLGKTTDTLDIWGTVTGECESSVTEEQIRRVIPNFTGEIEQIPPMYSAVQKRTVKGFMTLQDRESRLSVRAERLLSILFRLQILTKKRRQAHLKFPVQRVLMYAR